MMTPAEIAEQRDSISHLTTHLRTLGFGDLLEAIQDESFHPASGPSFGRFSLRNYCRSRGLGRRTAGRMLKDLRAAATTLMQNSSPLFSSSSTATSIPSA